MSTTRRAGLSVRLRLTLSYAALLLVTSAGLLAVVWLFLLRYVPDQAVVVPADQVPGLGADQPSLFIPGRSDLWQAFAPKAGLMMAALLVIGLGGGWLLAGRMLAPLRAVTSAAREVGTGSLSHRIRMAGPADELRELADTFDTMTARLEAQLGEQQRFAANASHELRTPLAITQTMLEVAQRDPGRHDVELLANLAAVNRRAIELTEALLVLSRADQATITPEPVDLSLVIEEAVETMLPLAEGRDVVVEVSGGTAVVPGSPTLLLQLVTNLLHNGIVHNLPERGRVWIRTGVERGRAVLTVESTGEELPPRLLDVLTEPFQRGAGRVRRDGSGAGLGLAIVRSITRAHGADLALVPRTGGGLEVLVRFTADAGPEGTRPRD